MRLQYDAAKGVGAKVVFTLPNEAESEAPDEQIAVVFGKDGISTEEVDERLSDMVAQGGHPGYSCLEGDLPPEDPSLGRRGRQPRNAS